MKRFTLLGVLAVFALAPPGRASASNLHTITVNMRPSYGGPAGCGGTGPCGHRSRSYGAVSQTFVIEGTGIQCQPTPTFDGYGPPGQCFSRLQLVKRISRRIHHDPPHCITQCFAGGPVCNCCDHHLRPVPPGLMHCLYAAMIKCGLKPYYNVPLGQPCP
jgi:hypothetical protein